MCAQGTVHTAEWDLCHMYVYSATWGKVMSSCSGSPKRIAFNIWNDFDMWPGGQEQLNADVEQCGADVNSWQEELMIQMAN
jgi:hypothetical protein